MYCFYCEKEIEDKSVFCKFCGRKLEGDDSGRRKEIIRSQTRKSTVDKLSKEEKLNIWQVIATIAGIIIALTLIFILFYNLAKFFDKKVVMITGNDNGEIIRIENNDKTVLGLLPYISMDCIFDDSGVLVYQNSHDSYYYLSDLDNDADILLGDITLLSADNGYLYYIDNQTRKLFLRSTEDGSVPLEITDVEEGDEIIRDKDVNDGTTELYRSDSDNNLYYYFMADLSGFFPVRENLIGTDVTIEKDYVKYASDASSEHKIDISKRQDIDIAEQKGRMGTNGFSVYYGEINDSLYFYENHKDDRGEISYRCRNGYVEQEEPSEKYELVDKVPNVIFDGNGFDFDSVEIEQDKDGKIHYSRGIDPKIWDVLSRELLNGNTDISFDKIEIAASSLWSTFILEYDEDGLCEIKMADNKYNLIDIDTDFDNQSGVVLYGIISNRLLYSKNQQGEDGSYNNELYLDGKSITEKLEYTGEPYICSDQIYVNTKDGSSSRIKTYDGFKWKQIGSEGDELIDVVEDLLLIRSGKDGSYYLARVWFTNKFKKKIKLDTAPVWYYVPGNGYKPKYINYYTR